MSWYLSNGTIKSNKKVGVGACTKNISVYNGRIKDK